MQLRAILFLVAMLPFVNANAGMWDNVKGWFGSRTKAIPTIDVLIVNDKPGTMIDVKGKYSLYNPHTNKQISKRTLGKRKLMQPHSSGLKWGEEFPGVFQIMIVPEDGDRTLFVDGVEYKGVVIVYDIGGSISVVNKVPIEDYLRSILPSRYREPYPEEALAAIAISSRTDAFYATKNPKTRFWAVDAIQEGYHGLESSDNTNGVDQAINATTHMVLSKTGTYEGIVTPFSAQWGVKTGIPGARAEISLDEAEQMARNGQHAAQILSRAFPGSHIELIY